MSNSIPHIIAPPCDSHITLLPNHRGGPPRYQCQVCQTRSMKNYEGHINSPAHLSAVMDYMERQLAEERFQAETNSSANGYQSPSWDEDQELYNNSILMSSPPKRPFSPLTLLRNLDDDQQYNSDNSDDSLTFDTLRQAFEALEHMEWLDDGEDEDESFEEALEDELRSGKVQDAIDWFPFKKMEVNILYVIDNILQDH
ncbi:hypothetical protein DFH28DRAFT_1047193 [Melampsora americana]|nr:hypothetical protein DFH28DRAFT_1063138 [Melampsora americana]KAH9825056.1 hypothetical protein DFH28DRAFT_1047193 [Melampsora americana]